MCGVATDTRGIEQLVGIGDRLPACMPWTVAGDLNLHFSIMTQRCQPFVKEGSSCYSRSGWPMNTDTHKSDWALSQGIALVIVRSWLGGHSKSCASDQHDVVVVTGAFEAVESQSVFTRQPLANSVWSRRAQLNTRSKNTSPSAASQPTAVVTPRQGSEFLRRLGEVASIGSLQLASQVDAEGDDPGTIGVLHTIDTRETSHAGIHDVMEAISAAEERRAE